MAFQIEIDEMNIVGCSPVNESHNPPLERGSGDSRLLLTGRSDLSGTEKNKKKKNFDT